MNKTTTIKLFLSFFFIFCLSFLYSYVEEVHIGEDYENILKKFGPPDEIKTWQYGYTCFYYRYVINFYFRKSSNKVSEVRFNPGYRFTTNIGIKIGDHITKAFKKFGYPLKEIECTHEQASNCAFGTNRVYYKVIAPKKAYKYVVGFQGVLFWCDENEDIIQIVFFENYGEPIPIKFYNH